LGSRMPAGVNFLKKYEQEGVKICATETWVS